MALTAYPVRQARLSASVEKAFGELFTFEAMRPTDDVNARHIPDGTRPAMVGVKATWHGPVKSATPTARGASSDDRSHNWTASHPLVNVEDAKMLWTIQMGDKVTRLIDGTIYAAGAPYADGYGRTTIPLTSRKR